MLVNSLIPYIIFFRKPGTLSYCKISLRKMNAVKIQAKSTKKLK
jgi:hypothetical protein